MASQELHVKRFKSNTYHLEDQMAGRRRNRGKREKKEEEKRREEEKKEKERGN